MSSTVQATVHPRLASKASSYTVPDDVSGDHHHSILVVEDDLDSREALKEYLLDMNMPGLNGEAFQRERRRAPLLAKVPVIVISGNELLSPADCDAQHVLLKPIDLPTLSRAIDVTCTARAPVRPSRRDG